MSKQLRTLDEALLRVGSGRLQLFPFALQGCYAFSGHDARILRNLQWRLMTESERTC
jgi:hypothetical protein